MAGELGVKTIGVAAVAVVLGFVLGGLGPNAKLRAAEDRIFELEKKVGRGDRAGTELARMIASGLRDGGGAGTDGGASSPPPAVLRDTDGQPGPDERTDDVAVGGTDEGPPALSRAETLETLQDTLAVRARIARQALIDEAGVTDTQLQRIDQVYGQMNDDLLDLTRRAAQSLRENGGRDPTRRELLAYGAEGIGVLADAEAQVLAALEPDQVADLSDEATDPSSFIAPEVIDVLQQLDDEGDAP